MQKIQYTFEFESAETTICTVNLNNDTLQLDQSMLNHVKAPWTKLSHCQCDNCPYSAEQMSHCQVATGLQPFVELFANRLSYERVAVHIQSSQRNFSKSSLSLSEGLCSLFGIIMSCSGCEIMDFLRPMVASHLPFASEDETLYKAVSMYLLAGYFRKIPSEQHPDPFIGLIELYEQIQKVNDGIAHRLATLQLKDACSNAVVNLNNYALFASSFSIEKSLEPLKKLFAPWLRQTHEAGNQAFSSLHPERQS